MFLYLDEAGDLGFNFDEKNPSRFFIITLLMCHSRKSSNVIKQAAERTLKLKLNAKSKSRPINELKGTGTELTIKKYFYKHAKKNEDWSIHSIILDKLTAVNKLAQPLDIHRLYNVISNHLLKQVCSSINTDTVNLFVDRSKNRDGVVAFDLMLRTSLDTLLPLNVPLNISHIDSTKNYGIQAVDLFCWGMFRKYEFQDSRWYDIFQGKIKTEQEFQT